jgi:hypothetical protein
MHPNIETPMMLILFFCSSHGNPFKSNPNAVFTAPRRWKKTWQLVLSKMKNGRHVCSYRSTIIPVYATLWEGYRNGHSMSSGGSGMYKSIDGVDRKSLNEGMPVGI